MRKIAYFLMLACLGIGTSLVFVDFSLMMIDGDMNPKPPINPDPILCIVIGVGVACACLAHNEGGKP